MTALSSNSDDDFRLRLATWTESQRMSLYLNILYLYVESNFKVILGKGFFITVPRNICPFLPRTHCLRIMLRMATRFQYVRNIILCSEYNSLQLGTDMLFLHLHVFIPGFIFHTYYPILNMFTNIALDEFPKV